VGRTRAKNARPQVGHAHSPLLKLRGGVLMLTPRRFWVPVAAALTLAGCRDATAPSAESIALAYVASELPAIAAPHFLRQAAGAPALETYRVSFWACDGEASTVTVNYQPVAGALLKQPFLRFDVPKNALATSPGGARMNRGDSVLVTLTIDPVTFAVEFQPSGMWFSKGVPAQLTIWYENADPDLNGDGVTDAADQLLEQQIAVWADAANSRWVRLPSDNDTTLPSVSTLVYHFSQYAVSW
jgi:hypothetical protein